MIMKKIIFEALNAYLSGKKSWKDFSSLFSSTYFDVNYIQDVEALTVVEIDFFGEINDCIEYTDNSSSEEERNKYGLTNENEVRKKVFIIVEKYENKGLAWK